MDYQPITKIGSAHGLGRSLRAVCSRPRSAAARMRPAADQPEKVWGSLGAGKGQFSKPRAIAIDDKDQLYIVDMTARIQVFDADGNYLRGWQTPEHTNGRPTGLTFDTIENHLLVADTHYNRILTYTPEGKLIPERTLGGVMGQGPGEFGLVSDVVRDRGSQLLRFGVRRIRSRAEVHARGQVHSAVGRPRHRRRAIHAAAAFGVRCRRFIVGRGFVQSSDSSVRSEPENSIKMWGTQGSELGQIYYPYCIGLDGKGHIYVCEFGNHRVQKFTLDGKSVGAGAAPGASRGSSIRRGRLCWIARYRMHVLDSMNHRVQRFVL